MTILFKITAFFLGIIMMFSGFTAVVPYELTGEENLLLNFVAISDTHVQTNDSTQSLGLMRSLKDMTSADAVAITGDLTMNGQWLEYFFFSSAITSALGKKSNLILSAGNHDICIKEDSYDKARDRFTSVFNQLTGRDIEHVYYSTVVKDYMFITLGSDTIAGVSQTFSDEQLDWLEYTLEQAAIQYPGKPIFVFNHNPLAGTNGVQWTWPGGDAGPQSEAIKALLGQYDNVFVFSGHMHNDYLRSGISKEDDGINYIDLPTLQDDGIGYVVEVYDYKVVFRTRSFVNSRWIDLPITVKLR